MGKGKNTEKNVDEEKKTEETEKKQKTIGEYGYVRVNIFEDEFESVGVVPSMYGSEAMTIIRDKLGLSQRARARSPINSLFNEAKEKAKNEGKLEELQKIVKKYLQS